MGRTVLWGQEKYLEGVGKVEFKSDVMVMRQ